MQNDRLSRHLLIALGLAMGLYAAGYWFIESRRVAHTPWQVSMEVDAAGRAKMEVRQKSLGLGPVELRFVSPTTNPPLARTEMIFDKPRPVPFPVPVGECAFADLTFLPGTVALKVRGTDVQMLPRVLTIGTNEFAWQKHRVIEIQPDGTPRPID